MNIKDFESTEKDVKDVIGKIFKRQRELMEKYSIIEGIPSWPLNIDLKESQVWLKDFLWRCTEELTEAWEAYLDDNMEHFHEELIDYLHFATELCILSGINETDVDNIDGEIAIDEVGDNVKAKMFGVIYELGLVGNLLKNKKWKQTQILTDIKKYRSYLITAYNTGLNLLMDCCGLSADDIYNFYFKKSEVNKFRQRSKY